MSPDIDEQAVMPVWPFRPESLMIDKKASEYEVRPVPLTSIALVTDKVLKVSAIYQVSFSSVGFSCSTD